MKQPIEMLLEGVTWEETEQQPSNPDGLPWATHSGLLAMAGHKIRCYRLNTGATIFDINDMNAFFSDALSANA